MNGIRAFIAGRSRLGLLLVLAVLAARLATPAGFMPLRGEGGVALVPCAGMGPMAMTDAPGHRPGKAHRTQQPCGFAALADVATGGADAILLVAALAFLLARGRTPRPRTPVRHIARLRPPLRAPPA